MYEQVLDPVGGSLFASAIFAALPLIALFVIVLLQSTAVLSWMVV